MPFRFTLFTGEYAHSRMIPGLVACRPRRHHRYEMNRLGYQTAYSASGIFTAVTQLPGYARVNRTPVPGHTKGDSSTARFRAAQRSLRYRLFADDDPVSRHIEGYQTDGLAICLNIMCCTIGMPRPFFSVVSLNRHIRLILRRRSM